MNSYTQLRQPIAQIFSIFSFICIIFSFFGEDYKEVLNTYPNYLLVSTFIEVLFVVVPFIGLLFKPSYNNINIWIIYFIITVIDTYLILFSFFNLYFLIGIHLNRDLFLYWIIGIISMLTSFLLDTIANIILMNVKSLKHHLIGLLFRLLGAFIYIIYIIYIILYFIVPHDIYNRNTFIELIFLTIGVHIIVVYLFIMYGDYTYSLEKGEVPE